MRQNTISYLYIVPLGLVPTDFSFLPNEATQQCSEDSDFFWPFVYPPLIFKGRNIPPYTNSPFPVFFFHYFQA